ncbi:hypothetical protein J7T55_004353 [Diaporthe amygdali]|uniref:uncharacterized protein n=1 Tax=Phomopsis amygdali TaxID=1214568 RepID=UPI0022FEBDFF|nr:uncharacterized protein J7T55_004353 [Diaporthe amygdali]KAJ0109803.1 hypothetical protein J7T55_004353 [Diaporthe amygdali]
MKTVTVLSLLAALAQAHPTQDRAVEKAVRAPHPGAAHQLDKAGGFSQKARRAPQGWGNGGWWGNFGGHGQSAAPSAAPTATPTAAAAATTAATTTNPVRVAAASSTSTANTTWNPPSDLVQGLTEVWDKYTTDNTEFKNLGYDHIMATKAKIQYCVRWDASTNKITAAQRQKLETVLSTQYNKWVSKALAGFDGFPYDSVDVSISGWATNNTALFEGDTSDLNIYTDTADVDGIPECDPACGRAMHYTDNDYSGCAKGEAGRYDVSLWLSENMNGQMGGFGGDWGQQLPIDYMIDNLDTENIHILLHEMGHTYGLDDFYDWTPTGQTSFIMMAGSAMEITDFDAWMARDWWRHIKSRYDL